MEIPCFNLFNSFIALVRSATEACINLVLAAIISNAKSGLEPWTAQLSALLSVYTKIIPHC